VTDLWDGRSVGEGFFVSSGRRTRPRAGFFVSLGRCACLYDYWPSKVSQTPGTVPELLFEKKGLIPAVQQLLISNLTWVGTTLQL